MDSINSYEQKAWEQAVSQHALHTRILKLAVKIENWKIANNALGVIAELEAKYPELKKN